MPLLLVRHARAGDRSIELRDELGEERRQPEGVELVRSPAQRNVVVCGHGGLVTSTFTV